MSWLDTRTFDEFSDADYKRHVRRHWDADPCGTSAENAAQHSPEFFRRVAEERYQTHGWLRERLQGLGVAGQDVLEIGCGLGSDHLVLAQAGARVSCLDLTPAHLAATRRNLQLNGCATRPVRGDLEQIPFADASFDLVFSHGVLHHTPRIERAVAEIHRVLRPGGRALITVYHKTSAFFLYSILGRYLFRLQFLHMPLSHRLSLIEYPNDDPTLITRLYRRHEIAAEFSRFAQVEVAVEHLDQDAISPGGALIPRRLLQRAAKYLGWYVVLEARK